MIVSTISFTKENGKKNNKSLGNLKYTYLPV